VSRLAELAASADEHLASYAASDPGDGRFAEEHHGPLRAFVLEAVHEGYLMHYAEPRAFEGMDGDLRLLAGDALFAQGLSRLAAEGDLEAVAELADLISGCAWAAAAGREDLLEPLWEAGATALSSAGGPGSRAVIEGELARGR